MTLHTLAEHGRNKQARLAQVQEGITYKGWGRLLKNAAPEPVVVAFRRGLHDLPAIIEGGRGTRAMVVMSRRKHTVHEFVVFEKVRAKQSWHFSHTEDDLRPVREFDRIYRRHRANSNKSTYLIVAPLGMPHGIKGMADFLSELTWDATGSAYVSSEYRAVGHGTLTFFAHGKVVLIHESQKTRHGNAPEVREIIASMVKSALPLLKAMAHEQLDLEWMPSAYARYIKQKYE